MWVLYCLSGCQRNTHYLLRWMPWRSWVLKVRGKLWKVGKWISKEDKFWNLPCAAVFNGRMRWWTNYWWKWGEGKEEKRNKKEECKQNPRGFSKKTNGGHSDEGQNIMENDLKIQIVGNSCLLASFFLLRFCRRLMEKRKLLLFFVSFSFLVFLELFDRTGCLFLFVSFFFKFVWPWMKLENGKLGVFIAPPFSLLVFDFWVIFHTLCFIWKTA